MLFAKELNILHFTLEGDNQALMKDLNAGSVDISNRGIVLEDILAVVMSCSSVSFSWVGREGNRCAHVLATRATDFNSGTWWRDEPPCILFDPLSVDLACIPFRSLADGNAEGERPLRFSFEYIFGSLSKKIERF